MCFLTLVIVNLRRHRLRALIGVAGICFGVAAMLTILFIVNGAIGMFERILAVDSHYLVFEKTSRTFSSAACRTKNSRPCAPWPTSTRPSRCSSGS